MLLVIVALYVVSRGVGIAHFAPHNDEVIYTEVAMLVADDWDANRYAFQDGRLFGEYREPLHGWATSLTVNLWQNPLLGMRLWSLAMGLAGLFFTHRLVARIWSESTAHVAAGLIVASEYHLYFDSVAIVEPFLYGLGAAYLYCLYDLLDRRRWVSAGLASALLSAMLLTKASAAQWVACAGVLPLLVLAARKEASRRQVWAQLGTSYALIAATTIAAKLAHDLLIPARYAARREHFVQLYVRSPGELLGLSIRDGLEALTFYGRDVLWSEFSVLLLPGLALVAMAVVWLSRTDPTRLRIYLLLILLYVVSFAPLALLARVHFIRHQGTGLYFADVLLGIAIVVAWGRLRDPLRSGLAVTGIAAVICGKLFSSYVPLVRWEQTALSMSETPAGWANGAGINELISEVSRLPAGVLVVDPQWGFPGTALTVFRRRFPQLQVQPLSEEFLDLQRVRQRVRDGARIYYVLDARRPGERPWADAILAHPLLCPAKRLIEKRFQGRSLEGTTLVICRAVL